MPNPSGSKKFGMDGEIAHLENNSGVMTFGEALRDATAIAMRQSPEVVLFGEGVTDPGAIFGSTKGLVEEFGIKRVVETPLSENAITGVCTGAALGDLRPILVHQRVDFTLLAMDQIVNHAAKWRYMSGGKLKVPVVYRCIIGKGWGQAAQHSQSLQSFFAHVPGLKVVMPTNAYDAKGMLLASIYDDNPVVFLEGRHLYGDKTEVPSGFYTVELGKAAVARQGKDVTVIALSYMVPEALKAAKNLEGKVSVEVIDLRSVAPLDVETIVASVKKTGRVVIADTSWKSFGVSAEIAATLYEKCFQQLKSPIERVTLQDTPTPCSPALEKLYYPTAQTIEASIRKITTPF